MTVSILHERREVADCLPLVRCASIISNFSLKGERAIASSPACGRGLRRGFAMSAGMAALHLIPQPAGYAITSDLESVVCSPSRMASRFISNESEVQP